MESNIIMNDFLSNSLGVGDYVVFLDHSRNSSSLYEAYVVGFTASKVKLIMLTEDDFIRRNTNIINKSPEKIVLIRRETDNQHKDTIEELTRAKQKFIIICSNTIVPILS